MSDDEYYNFFKKIEKFKELQNKQKRRGLNDFNLLTTVRKYHDEIYLHSALIGTLLNPHGKHYQNTLFLELFLKEIALDTWGLILDDVIVYVEYKDIDLYITDGRKHIIIENKIFAKDQPCQLIKYINIILQENKDILKTIQENKINDEFLQVVYLTAQSKKVPDDHKLENEYIFFTGGDKKLDECSKKDHTKMYVPESLKNYKAKYRKITYKTEILRWLQVSQKEIKNITNLHEAIKQYIDIVEMVNNNYEGNVMSLKQYILKEELAFDMLKNIVAEYQKLIEDTKKSFLTQLEERISKIYDESYKDKYIRIPIIDKIYLQIGIESNKVFITIYKQEAGDWGNIESKEKNIIFNKIADLNIDNKKFNKPDWNGYATIYIIDVESKEFLEVETNINLILGYIKDIVQRLKE